MGATGRFGPRYGRKVRLRVETIEVKMHEKHRCPQCGRNAVERVATSIWRCRKCGTRFAGGAYTPETASGKIALRAIKGIGAGENV